MSLSRPAPRVLLMVVAGHEIGEHGDRPTRTLHEALEAGPAALFVDARRTRAASTDVSHQWAQWLSANRDRLLAVHVLPGSWFIRMTVEFVRRFTGLDELIRTYDSPAEFEAALRQALGR